MRQKSHPSVNPQLSSANSSSTHVRTSSYKTFTLTPQEVAKLTQLKPELMTKIMKLSHEQTVKVMSLSLEQIADVMNLPPEQFAEFFNNQQAAQSSSAAHVANDPMYFHPNHLSSPSSANAMGMPVTEPSSTNQQASQIQEDNWGDDFEGSPQAIQQIQITAPEISTQSAATSSAASSSQSNQHLIVPAPDSDPDSATEYSDAKPVDENDDWGLDSPEIQIQNAQPIPVLNLNGVEQFDQTIALVRNPAPEPVNTVRLAAPSNTPELRAQQLENAGVESMSFGSYASIPSALDGAVLSPNATQELNVGANFDHMSLNTLVAASCVGLVNSQ